MAGLSKTDFFTHAAFYGGTAFEELFMGWIDLVKDLDFTCLYQMMF